jgi:trimethylamine--corrinoid protein Co-methyltransferase
MRFDPLRAVSEDELDAIHRASLRVLAETGIDFLDETALRQLADAGCDVDGNRVRFDPELVMSLVATAPSSFTLHAPNPARNLHIGDDVITYTSVASPPFVTGLGRDRRNGNREDYRNLLKMGQVLNSIHTVAGYPVEPMDLHPSVRHLHATHDMLTLLDKVPFVYSLSRQRNIDAIEISSSEVAGMNMILAGPNGKKYHFSIDDNGTPSVEEITSIEEVPDTNVILSTPGGDRYRFGINAEGIPYVEIVV